MKRVILFVLIIASAYHLDARNQVDTVTVFSALMKKQIKNVVVVPKDYKRSVKYPVVYLLHGYSDSFSKWIKTVPSIKELANQYNLIIVCPDGGFNSWYMDSPLDSTYQYESFIISDLIKFVDNHYSTITNRKGRAITGLSMGGHGALYLAIRNKNLFAQAGSMSGGVDLTFSTKAWEIKKLIGSYEENSEIWKSRSVINLTDNLQNKDLRLIIDCGVKDFFYQINEKLHQKLLKQGIEHDYTTRPGEHNWQYWTNAIRYQMLFFSTGFQSE